MIVTKLISRSLLNDEVVAFGAVEHHTTGAHNHVQASYKGTYEGVDYTIVCTMTRHMGDYTDLLVSQDDFPSKAALVRYYRAIKASLV